MSDFALTSHGQIISNAVFSPCRIYRYVLTREWDISRPKCVFIGLNPSTADEYRDDPTVRRCMGYAKLWGYGGIVMLNLFAYRATNPNELRTISDPVGPENNDYLEKSCYMAPRIIAAWGSHGVLMNRETSVLDLLHGYPLYHLGLTKHGHPKHPLYLKKDAEAVRWR